jgi:hypothetical protein
MDFAHVPMVYGGNLTIVPGDRDRIPTCLGDNAAISGVASPIKRAPFLSSLDSVTVIIAPSVACGWDGENLPRNKQPIRGTEIRLAAQWRCTALVHRDMTSASLCGRGSILRAAWIFYGVEVADVEASSVGTIEVGLRPLDGGIDLDDDVLGGGEASKISGPCESLILGGGHLFDKIDDGPAKLCVWNLHESFGELKPIRRGEII